MAERSYAIAKAGGVTGWYERFVERTQKERAVALQAVKLIKSFDADIASDSVLASMLRTVRTAPIYKADTTPAVRIDLDMAGPELTDADEALLDEIDARLSKAAAVATGGQPRDARGRWTDSGGGGTYTFGGSPASVTRGKGVTESCVQAFGRDLTDNELNDLAGAPDGATINVKNLRPFGGLEITATHKAYGLDMRRLVSDDGQRITNDHFYVNQNKKTEGMGTRAFATQITLAKQLGVETIRTTAGKSRAMRASLTTPAIPAMNGYYTWPRLGYDAAISPRKLFDQKGKTKAYGETVRKEYTKLGSPHAVSDLMKTEEGRSFWKKHGVQSQMQFSLNGAGYDRFTEYAESKGITLTKAGPDVRKASMTDAERQLRDQIADVLTERAIVTDEQLADLMKSLADVAQMAGLTTLADLGLGVAGAFDWADQRTTFQKLFPVLHDEITGYMRKAVHTRAADIADEIIAAADPANPKTIPETIKSIRAVLPTMTRKQAVAIARTETARVYGAVEHETFKRNDIARRRWATAARSPAATDSPVCIKCTENADAGWVNIGDEFPSGHDHAPAHTRCRCSLIADVRDWLPPRELFLGTDDDDTLAASVSGVYKGRVYDTARYIRARELHLKLHPFCVDCESEGKQTRGYEIDHHKSMADGGKPYDRRNFRTKCKPHHSRKTATVDAVRAGDGRYVAKHLQGKHNQKDHGHGGSSLQDNAVNRVELASMDLANERVSVINKDGITVFEKDGTHDQVPFTDDEIATLRGMDGLVLTHNHPKHNYEYGTFKDLDLSEGDISIAGQIGATEIRSTDRITGTVASLRLPKNSDGAKWAEDVRSSVRETYTELNNKIMSGTMTVRDANNQHIPVVVTKLQAKYPGVEVRSVAPLRPPKRDDLLVVMGQAERAARYGNDRGRIEANTGVQGTREDHLRYGIDFRGTPQEAAADAYYNTIVDR